MGFQIQSADSLFALWEAACISYGEEAGTRLTSPDFPQINTPSELSSQLDSEKEHFTNFRLKKRPLFHAMQTVLSPFENFGDIISGAVSTAFPPASTIMGVMLLLVRSARRVSDAFDSVHSLFQKLGYFAQRLDSYHDVPLSDGMKSVIVKVLVTSLRVCAVSQGLMSRGSFKARVAKWAKNILVEDTSVQGLLAELEDLTRQEHKMVSAHNLTLTSQAVKNTVALLEKSELEDEKQRISRLKALLDPVSASGQVYFAINEGRIPDSGKWIEGRIREWWTGDEPLLWIHGGPGVGKSYLASKIIGDLAQTGSALVASFFCKNNDVDLRSFNKALRTLAWQVVVQSPSFAIHAEEFCLKGDVGNTHMVWKRLLLDYFAVQSEDEVCFIIDGIDEADPEEQERFFSLLKNTYTEATDRKFRVRVVLVGRDSIGGILDEHSLGRIHDIEINNHQNKDDLHTFVVNKLQNSKLFRNASEFQDEVVKEICAQAEGLWEWANLVIKNLSRCRTKEQIRKVVKSMPKGISAMLSEELQRLAKELSASDTISDDEAGSQIDQLNIILSFVTLAQRPLTVEMLNLVLEILLGEEVLNLEDDLHKAYSSLFSLRVRGPDEDDVEYLGSAVVTFRHSSFYEFFKLSSTSDTGPLHVNCEQAGADFLYVLLYALAKRDAPSSCMLLGMLQHYAYNYLPWHLESTDPGQVEARRQHDISCLLASLLGNELLLEKWIINSFYIQFSSDHNSYASSQISPLGQYWWGFSDRDTANHAAKIVLNWLAPDQRRLLEETAGNQTCLFGVLFSSMARFCAYIWLSPEEIFEEDGLPAALSILLHAYNEITTIPTTTGEASKLAEIKRDLPPDSIIQVAESQGLQKTAMWHARVAQALLHHLNLEEAIVHFQIALNECDEANAFSKRSLSVIHKDLSRACKAAGRHKEALEHLEFSISMRDKSDDCAHGIDGYIADLLDTAYIELRVNEIDKAISTAQRAWEEFGRIEIQRRPLFGTLLRSFLATFSELRQIHRLRSVWDFALEHSEDIPPRYLKGIEGDNFAMFLVNAFTIHPRVMHSVLHYVLTSEDTKHLNLITSIPVLIENEQLNSAAEMQFYFASVLFEKNRPGDAVQMWCETLTMSNPDNGWWTEKVQKKSLCRLAAVCLYTPEVPFRGVDPLVLTEEIFLEVALVVSSWLQTNGHTSSAQRLLCEVIERCIVLLSDDDPQNDIDAFVTLFKALLLTTDDDEDLRAASYLIKAWNWESAESDKSHDTEQEIHDNLPSSLEKAHLADDQSPEQNPESDHGQAEPDKTWSKVDLLSECFICRHEISSTSQWYFCRSCPSTALCRPCYWDIQEKRVILQDHPHGFTGKCSREHIFFYTGQALRKAERVPQGMVPLVDANGQKRVVWVDEWKERLSKKWKCTKTDMTYSFDSGISKWCMQALPEAQRERWASFFKV
jgi:tetratricopeptide (TPR) repeat protein